MDLRDWYSRGWVRMALSEGDFVLIEYTVRVKETGNVVDTTSEEIARREGIYDSNRLYGPVLVVIGRRWVIQGLDDALKELDVGVEKEIVVPPEKAYGLRDPGKIRVFSIREFRRRGIDVKIGDAIDFGGQTGIVKSITGGRVVVDFNHPLAGKTLVYKVKVLKKLEEPVEKLKALTARHLRIGMEDVSVEFRPGEKTVVVDIPTRIMTRRDIQYSKIALVSDIYEFFKDSVRKVVLQEVFERKVEEKEGAVEAREGVGEARESVEEIEEASETRKENVEEARESSQ